ncbi:Aldo/keto reductase family protein [Shimia gijangensis]|uniref:Aldo/keto reductase family protein n=1 Tax=Shimia gijangensis TaxID=1470563 RepID=A0A1M6IX06_9RHOB|nr:Aldo/keto reductase family protein [Shimia gijangensis]
MKMNPLGRTGIKVSEFCLGTMTFGTQTSESEAHAQIETALAGGINFVDAAEMYPVNPLLAENLGKTEEIIGNWFAKSGRRAEVVMATKHSGAGYKAARNGNQFLPRRYQRSLRALYGGLKPITSTFISSTGPTAALTCSVKTGDLIRQVKTGAKRLPIWKTPWGSCKERSTKAGFAPLG